jgi:hypothetical protein
LVASLTTFAPSQFFERIVTADETWVHHYEPESKAQNVAWKRSTSSAAKKFKSEPSAGKIMLTPFRVMEGAILVHFTPKGKTVKSELLWCVKSEIETRDQTQPPLRTSKGYLVA